jgi:hypothetical protein
MQIVMEDPLIPLEMEGYGDAVRVIGGDIGPVEIGPDELGPANRTGRNRTLRNRPTLKIFLKRSYFSVKVGLFLPIISEIH